MHTVTEVAWQFTGDMRLTALDCTLRRAVSRTPLEPTWTIVPSVLPLAGGAVFTIAYECTVYDSARPAREAAVIKVALAFLFTVDVEPTVEQCEAQVPVVLRMAEPHLREVMHSLTLQMGLPPLVIDLPQKQGDRRGEPQLTEEGMAV